jgi:hypothetical protein
MTKIQAKKRLEEIRKEIKKERVSYGEIAELQDLNRQDVEDCIGYAVKEGYLDEDVARKMTWKEKCDYRGRCDSVEPYDETPW